MVIHKPVLLKEVIKNLNLRPGMTVVDGTLGAGGHSLAILKKILPGGKLISIDWDWRAVENFQKILAKESYEIPEKTFPASIKNNISDEHNSPCVLAPLFSGDKIVGYWCGVRENYTNLDKILESLKVNKVEAILADLGFSSDQIEDPKRGFSFLQNGPASNASRSDAGWPLDMRYSPETQKLTAADVVNNYSEKDLAEIFWRYGEEKYARRIAREIIRARKTKKIRKTKELVEIIAKAVSEKYKKGRLHFATRTFQALRIEVNQELKNLEIFLEKAVKVLAGGGRLAIISFHSLEDRIVKNYFLKESRDCICPSKFLRCVCGHKKTVKLITKKPIQPSEKEIRDNPRARSAKMRVAEKI